MEAEIKVMFPKAKECLRPLEAKKGEELDCPLEPPEEASSADPV